MSTITSSHMAAFEQYPVSFLMDSVFSPNISAIKTPSIDEFIPNLQQFYSLSSEISHPPLMSYNNQEGSSIDGASAHESSCLEQQSIDDPSSVSEKQRNDSLSMAENAESREQVTQTCAPIAKKRKSRKGCSPNSSISKKDKQVKCKKQKEEKEAVKEEKDDNKITEDPPKGYIHVRARRGQATDSHSLAERVRREKISERMKMLQALVPGCDKVTGKALMLDEIINYVQSLQNQVEFLSLKLASVDPTVYTFGLMDHESMLFGTQAINNANMTLPMPVMQPTSNGSSGSIDQQPQVLANTNAMSCSATSSASAPAFPSIIADSSTTLFQQEQKPNVLSLQDPGSLYWGLNEQQRQSIINQFGFNNTNLYSFQ